MKQTPLEKTNELIDKFESIEWTNGDTGQPDGLGQDLSIQCALICVQEVIDADPYQYIKDFYTEVKRELEKML